MKGKMTLLVLSAAWAPLFLHAQTLAANQAAHPLPAAAGLDDSRHEPSRTVPPLRPAPSAAMPLAPKTQNGITYLCGGVGEEEAARMKSAAQNYDMLLTFSARDAGYLADVDVGVTDMQGAPILKTFCSAPMLLIDLPHPGNYKVRAETAGYTIRKTVKVEGRESKTSVVSLVWPQQIAQSVTPPQTSGDSGTAGASAAGGGEEEEMNGCGDDYPARNRDDKKGSAHFSVSS